VFGKREDWVLKAPVLIPRPETYDLVNLALKGEFGVFNPWSSYQIVESESELHYNPSFGSECLFDEIKGNYNQEKIRFLEIGSGSGCVSISLVDELIRQDQLAKLGSSFACDICYQAVKLSKINARKILQNQKDYIKFIFGDFKDFTFNEVESKDSKHVDFIISNPPYIGRFKITYL
jgi:methylase of polypeptide subunit release factors